MVSPPRLAELVDARRGHQVLENLSTEMFFIYIIINELQDKTYVGFTDNTERRVKEHSSHKVRTTKYFGKFVFHILEKVEDKQKARIREKYWKSSTGRKRIEGMFFH